MNARGRRPRVFIHRDGAIGSTSLSRMIEEAGCELAWSIEARSLCDDLENAGPPLDLVVLLFDSGAADLLASIASLRRRSWMTPTPVLIIASDVAQLDLWQLRAVGVIAVIDLGAPAEHLRFRIGQAAWKSKEGRRFERAPCCIPVGLGVGGESLMVYAVSLSIGGMALASPRRIEPKTRVELRFSLDDGEEQVSVQARTVHLREVRRPGADYEIGVSFLDLPERLFKEIGSTVSHLLAAWDVVRSMELDRSEEMADEGVERRQRESRDG